LIISLRNAFPPSLTSAQVYAVIVVILSVISWASLARVIRGMTLSFREQQFVLAARAIGQSNLRIICRHILPNTFSYVIVSATLNVPYYILGEVVLSYLGVGMQEPQPSWGLMLNAAHNTVYLERFPWLLAPGAAIFVTVLAFNFLGDGLRDAADVKQI
jgi:peptide/nickel transport system permease protein